jgi:hypothetical protein
MAFIKEQRFTKKVVALLSGKEAKRIGVYKLPQFGGYPPDGKPDGDRYTDEEAGEALQEAVNHFGGDGLVRFLNWAIVVRAQRMSNNDLRTAAAGLDAASQARYTLLMNMAKRQAEAEVGEYDKDGELVIDRKSKAYLEAVRESLDANLKKPKFADLKSAFDAVEGGEINFDKTTPGSLNLTKDDVVTTSDEEKEEA